MQSDEAMTDLAKQRMTNAERSIRGSADSLATRREGRCRPTGPRRRRTVGTSRQAGRRVEGGGAGRKTPGRREHRPPGRPAATRRRKGTARAKTEASRRPFPGRKRKRPAGNEPSSETGEGGGGPGNSRSARWANRQRARAEDVRTAEDILNEAEKDAKLTDPDLARALEKAAAENSPKKIAAAIDRAAKALAAGERERANRDIRDSAKRLEALADQIEERGTASPSRSSKPCWLPRRKRPSC